MDSPASVTGAGQMGNKGAAGGMPACVQRTNISSEAGVAESFSKGIVPRTADEAGYDEMLSAEVKDSQLIHPEEPWLCLCNGGGGYAILCCGRPSASRSMCRGASARIEVDAIEIAKKIDI